MTPPFEIRERRGAAVRALDHLEAHPDGLAARGLAPLAAAYGLGARLFRTEERLPAVPPCVGVGNLRVGGTGKTPVVSYLAEELLRRGRRVGILTRGYRATDGTDEPEWLRETGAVVEVDPNRGRGREALLERGVDVILLDDALQTRWRPPYCLGLGLAADRHRDPRCLPAGPAREGARSARTRAQLWAWRHDGGFPSGSAPHRELHFRLEPVGLRSLNDGGESPLAEAAGRRALAVSGLARPGSFEADLCAGELTIAGSLRFEDHWHPCLADVEEIRDFARQCKAEVVLCPEKNAAGLAEIGVHLPVWAVRSRVRWWGDAAFAHMESWFGQAP